MRRRMWLLASIALVATAGCLGGSAGATADVASFEPRVSVGGELPSTGPDGTRTCTYVGAPPGRFGIFGQAVVERPTSGEATDPVRFRVQVRLEGTEWETVGNASLASAGRERVQLLYDAKNEGTVSAGESVTVELRVRAGGRTVATASRTVTARQAPGCADDSGR